MYLFLYYSICVLKPWLMKLKQKLKLPGVKVSHGIKSSESSPTEYITLYKYTFEGALTVE